MTERVAKPQISADSRTRSIARLLFYHASLAKRRCGQLKLGLDEGNKPASVSDNAREGGVNQGLRDKRHVHDTTVHHPRKIRKSIGMRGAPLVFHAGKIGGRDGTGVESLGDTNAVVPPQAGMELTVPRIHGVDTRRTVTKQAVGKAARGCADICHACSLDRRTERIQRRLQLESAATDVAGVGGSRHTDGVRPLGDLLRGFSDDPSVQRHRTVGYELLGEGAAIGIPLLYQIQVGSHAMKGLYA